jgi:CubicO group peptidase (beta-lactamase class C family)
VIQPTPVIAALIATAAAALPSSAQQPQVGPPAPRVETESPAGPVARVAHQLDRADLEAWLDGFLPYALQRGDVAGAVVVVVKDGQVLLQKGYGYANAATRAPVDPERTLFRPGSVAKLFTWTAIMQLVERGELDLDRDLNAYLDFRIPPRDGQPVTMRNVMTHTPGFEEIIKNLMASDPERLLPLGPYVKAGTPERIFPPGRMPAYSNYGVALAGYIIERVSGESFDDYIDRHIFTPLGMANSTFRQPLPNRFIFDMSKGYQLGSGPEELYELVGPAPAGALAATGADMARFMIAHLRDGAYGSARILNPETVRLMHGRALPIIPPLNSMVLGFYQRNLNGHRVVAHDGDTQYFHSALSLFADDGVGVYLSMNSTGKDGAAGPIRTGLIEQFADRYFPAPEDDRRVDPKLAAEHARLMAGVYENSRRVESTFLSLIYLPGQVEVTVTDQGALSVPAFQGLNSQPKEWVEVAPFVWREVGGKERLAAKVENGKVVMFSADEVSPFMMFLPTPWWKSSAWLVPLLLGSLTALMLTVVAWPIAAVTRRRYRVAFNLTGSEARAYRLVRVAGIAIILTMAAWAGTVASLETNLSAFSPRLDPWIWTLHLLSLVVFVGAVGVALWNARMTWIGKRSRFAKLWSLVLAVACLGVLWVGVVFKLIGFGANY